MTEEKPRDESAAAAAKGCIMPLIFVALMLGLLYLVLQLPKEPSPESSAMTLEACRQDVRCWGKKYSIDAELRCRRPIERLAQNDMRWTDGWTETKFPRIRWENQDEGLITYIGDNAQFQNGFGVWQNVIYFCTYDPATDSAVSVEAEVGRLP